MSFEKIVEKAIRDAIKEGKFDDLPNAGRPLDLEDYFNAPEEVELLKDIDRLEGDLESARDPEWRESLRGQIEDHRVRLALLLE